MSLLLLSRYLRDLRVHSVICCLHKQQWPTNVFYAHLKPIKLVLMVVTTLCTQTYRIFVFPCAHDDCSRSFKSYAGFKTHLYRDHVVRHKSTQFLVSQSTHTTILSCASFACNVPLCNRASGNMRDLIQHVKGHIEQGVCMDCPFAGCSKKFNKKSTFSSHMSRKHHRYATLSHPLADSAVNVNYTQVNLNTVATQEASDSDLSNTA